MRIAGAILGMVCVVSAVHASTVVSEGVCPLMTAPARAGPPPWAPAHGARAKGFVRYRYYPELQVYFDPGRKVWFYIDASSGDWRMVADLPTVIVVGFSSYVELDIEGGRPYVYHRDIRSRYPPAHVKPHEKKGEDRHEEHKKERHGGY